MTVQTLKRFALIVLGSLALALGLFGMAVPVLPTTPFLLLAAFCYMRSSQRLYDWLINHRLFGAGIRNYIRHRAISSQTRTGALLFLWVSLAISMILVVSWPVRILLLAVGLAVSWHLALLKTLTGEECDGEIVDHDDAVDMMDGNGFLREEKAGNRHGHRKQGDDPGQ